MEISTQNENLPLARQSLAARFVRFAPKISGRLWATFGLIFASSVVASTIILWLDPRTKPPQDFFFTPFVSLVYSLCIGSLLSIGLKRFLPKFSDKKPLVKFLCLIVLIVAATVLGFGAGSGFLLGINALVGYAQFDIGWVTWRLSLFMGLLFGAIIFVNDSLKLKLEKTELELKTRQLAEERARNLAAEARFTSLESRVRPHFLFNTLNSISALIREEPEKAERMLERLAAILRVSLDSANQKTVSLAEEVRVVRDYLEIEKTRFAGRLRFSIEIPESAEIVKIPPFALQTLVENSVKHAVSKKRGGGEIRIFAHTENDVLRLEVFDDGSGFEETAIRSGRGLDNLQARLSALYGGAARLEIGRRENFTIVSLQVPLESGEKI